MSSEDTAEYFNGMSEEKIITWMLSNLSTDQIKECLNDEKPEMSQLEKIRSNCVGKRYVIHNLDEKTKIVSFWYLEGSNWNYYKQPLSKFEVNECGGDTNIDKSIEQTYLKNSSESSDFQVTLNQYKQQNINIDWVKLKEQLPEIQLEKIRTFCAGKKYVIHKIEDETVYYWYLYNGQWRYYNTDLSDFPKKLNDDAEECGNDEKEIDPKNVMKAYDENILSDQTKVDEFKKVKDEYSKLKINDLWLNPLLLALNIQKSINVPTEYSKLFQFFPVLIESVFNGEVHYYYLNNELKFIYAHLPFDKFKDDLQEIMDDINLNIINSGDSGGSNSDTLGGYTQRIKDSVNNIVSDDLKRIKKIYTNFPLSEKSTYFMNDLFNDNKFGLVKQLNLQKIKTIIKEKYGQQFLDRYKPVLISNNSIQLVKYVKK